MSLRKATLADLPMITSIASEFLGNLPKLKFDAVSFMDTVRFFLTNPQFITLVEPEGALFMGMVSPWLLDPRLKACFEFVWYVTPALRKQGLGSGLLSRAQRIAKQDFNCSFFVAGHSVDYMAEAMEAKYLKSGFAPHEKLYIKNL